jgi:hypothetical protein
MDETRLREKIAEAGFDPDEVIRDDMGEDEVEILLPRPEATTEPE